MAVAISKFLYYSCEFCDIGKILHLGMHRPLSADSVKSSFLSIISYSTSCINSLWEKLWSIVILPMVSQMTNMQDRIKCINYFSFIIPGDNNLKST